MRIARLNLAANVLKAHDLEPYITRHVFRDARFNSHLINVITSFLYPVGGRFNPTEAHRNFYESLSRFL
jgi:hypothetical protein